MIKKIEHDSPNGKINSLMCSYTIWQHGSGSSLAKVMSHCTTPSYFLNLCWFCVVLLHSPVSKFVTILYNEFNNYTVIITVISPRGQWVYVNPLIHFTHEQVHVNKHAGAIICLMAMLNTVIIVCRFTMHGMGNANKGIMVLHQTPHASMLWLMKVWLWTEQTRSSMLV